MGLLPEFIEFIDLSIEKAFGSNVQGLKMLELGNQLTPNRKTGKDIYLQKGFQHTSVDLNGLDGAIVKDLTKPEQFAEWFEHFEVLTNSGTTEHVEPHEKQYEAFKIIHDCVAPMGIMIHIVPDVIERDERNHWVGHCANYYSESFFNMLAKENYYKVIENKVILGLRSVSMIKKVGCSFMNSREKLTNEVKRR